MEALNEINKNINLKPQKYDKDNVFNLTSKSDEKVTNVKFSDSSIPMNVELPKESGIIPDSEQIIGTKYKTQDLHEIYASKKLIDIPKPDLDKQPQKGGVILLLGLAIGALAYNIFKD